MSGNQPPVTSRAFGISGKSLAEMSWQMLIVPCHRLSSNDRPGACPTVGRNEGPNRTAQVVGSALPINSGLREQRIRCPSSVRKLRDDPDLRELRTHPIIHQAARRWEGT
jgi:hypothetical protein